MISIKKNMFGIGAEELVLILIIILVLFGGKKLPELSRSIGQSLRELRRGISGDLDEPNDKKKKVSQKKLKNKDEEE